VIKLLFCKIWGHKPSLVPVFGASNHGNLTIECNNTINIKQVPHCSRCGYLLPFINAEKLINGMEEK